MRNAVIPSGRSSLRKPLSARSRCLWTPTFVQHGEAASAARKFLLGEEFADVQKCYAGRFCRVSVACKLPLPTLP